jgi:hypothetical protein
MQVVTGEGEIVEIGFAHRRPPHRDMRALRDRVIERAGLQETQVRPAAWFENGRLEIAGMEHERRWIRPDDRKYATPPRKDRTRPPAKGDVNTRTHHRPPGGTQ